MKLTKRAPTAELMGPKNGKIMAKSQIGITTGNLARALRKMLFVSCIPITFSHTKYSGVHANPNVINWNRKPNHISLELVPREKSTAVLRGYDQLNLKTINKLSDFSANDYEINLMNEHEDDSSIAPTGLWEEGEGIWMIQELITKSPVHSRSRWKCQCKDIESGY